MSDAPKEKADASPPLSEYEKTRRATRAKFVVGGTDPAGNRIHCIYAIGDEYVIYSIDAASSIKGIRTSINTIKEVDPKPILDFQSVKPELDRVKSLSGRCEDPTYTSRVAHALSMAIHGDPDKARAILGEIAAEISKDYRERVVGKLTYMAGTFSLAMIVCLAALIAYVWRDTEPIQANERAYELLLVCAFATLGGLISVSVNIRKIVVDTGLGFIPYFFYGTARNVFSIAGGMFTLLVIKANLFFGFINDLADPLCGVCAMGFLAGFSEKLVPNTLNKLEEKADGEPPR